MNETIQITLIVTGHIIALGGLFASLGTLWQIVKTHKIVNSQRTEMIKDADKMKETISNLHEAAIEMRKQISALKKSSKITFERLEE